ncbi:MAG TPA: hypothetical protein VGE01_12500 [Fimbriimonas sp.]
MERKLTTTLLALAASVAMAQFAINFRDQDDNLAASGPGGGSLSRKVAGNISLVLKGTASAKAKISSKSQGLTIAAGSITAEIVPAANQRRSRIQTAKATNGVEIDKDVLLNGARESTEIRAASATYASGSAEGRLDLAGSVSIRNVNEARKQTSVVTGTNGVVLVDPDAAGNTAVRTATLSGPVRVNVVEEAMANRAASNFTATGDRLVYQNTAKPATITLTGDVRIVGTGPNMIDTQGVTRATIFLNERGEMTEYELSGDPTTTTYRKGGSGS